MNFEIENLEIEGIQLIHSTIFSDERGFFQELFKETIFKQLGIPHVYNQYNYSYSHQNVIRGLHYQTPPHEQGKLIMVISGKIQDVVVDLRENSTTFLKWLSININNNESMLYIPPGFAHGFAVLSPEAHVIYACSKEYQKKNEEGIKYDDPKLAIDWQVKDPIVSQKRFTVTISRNGLAHVN